MDILLAGIGLALVIEGLVFALAPSRLEDLARIIEETPVETRRAIGLAAVAIGVLLVWLARSISG